MKHTKQWNVKSSTFAKATFNPIRNIVENLVIVPNPDKPMIALSIGDPTVFGNLKPAKEITDAVVEAINKGKYNGYAPSTGYLEAREAVAKYCSTPTSPVEAKDIILCSGCSCALDISITALCSPGQNILVPRPGFPIYQTLAEGLGISVKYYNLLPESNWEVDLDMMNRIIDENTAAIVVNNPSNPCGSVFSKEHLLQILSIAERNKVPIIADEIYDNFGFEGYEFYWLASLTSEVPILSCGGLTKRFLVPGWRMGWITIHDRNNVFGKEVRQGLQSLSQRIIGSNTLVQAALPAILANTPQHFYDHTLKTVQDNAMLSYNMLKRTKGLHPVMPQGAMYMMVGIDMNHFPEFESDLKLVEKMISEESVFCLPGKCFNVTNFFRVVLTVPAEQMREACQRIYEFCERHYQDQELSREMGLENHNGISHESRNGNIHENSHGTINGSTNGNGYNSTNGNGSDESFSDTEMEITDSLPDPLSKKFSSLQRDLIIQEIDRE